MTLVEFINQKHNPFKTYTCSSTNSDLKFILGIRIYFPLDAFVLKTLMLHRTTQKCRGRHGQDGSVLI